MSILRIVKCTIIIKVLWPFVQPVSHRRYHLLIAVNRCLPRAVRALVYEACDPERSVFFVSLSIVLCLAFEHVCIFTAPADQFIMRAAFEDDSVFEEVNMVRHSDGG